jgi:hypothetical protein
VTVTEKSDYVEPPRAHLSINPNRWMWLRRASRRYSGSCGQLSGFINRIGPAYFRAAAPATRGTRQSERCPTSFEPPIACTQPRLPTRVGFRCTLHTKRCYPPVTLSGAPAVAAAAILVDRDLPRGDSRGRRHPTRYSWARRSSTAPTYSSSIGAAALVRDEHLQVAGRLVAPGQLLLLDSAPDRKAQRRWYVATRAPARGAVPPRPVQGSARAASAQS